MENIWKKLEKDPILLILGIFLCMAGVILSITVRNPKIIPYFKGMGGATSIVSVWGLLTLIGSIMFLLYFLLRYPKVRNQPPHPFRTLTLLGFISSGINALFLVTLYVGLLYFTVGQNLDVIFSLCTIWMFVFMLTTATSIVYVFFHYQKKPVYPPMNP